jgi:hypothetical protein
MHNALADVPFHRVGTHDGRTRSIRDGRIYYLPENFLKNGDHIVRADT